MLLIPCPNCGPRSAAEFRFGGEAASRPPDPLAASAETWTDYLYMRQNSRGLQTEWWYHRAGCALWFLAERHTQTNQIVRTYLKPTTPAAGGS